MLFESESSWISGNSYAGDDGGCADDSKCIVMVCSGVILLPSVAGEYEEASDVAVCRMLIVYRRLCIAVIVGMLFGI